MPDPREPPEPPDWETPDTAPTARLPAAHETYGYVVPPVVVEEEEEEPPRRLTEYWPWLLALLGIVLLGIAALWYFGRDSEPATKPVPAVVRLTEADAVRRLEDEGFRTQVERGKSDDAPPGIVYAQTPGAGRALAEGSTVTILVSTGDATVEVPDVRGLPADRAEALLEDAGLTANRFGVLSDEPVGTVVAQSPAADGRAPMGSAVRINVSQGTGRVEVPDVVGQTAAAAGATLRGAGLGTPRVFTVPSARPASEVVAQSPAAGTQAAEGTAIRINVSDGSGASGGGTTTGSSVELPDVVGTAEADAVRRLEAAGATVAVRREAVDDPGEIGLVLSQEPGGGETIAPGDRVEIVVGD